MVLQHPYIDNVTDNMPTDLTAKTRCVKLKRSSVAFGSNSCSVYLVVRDEYVRLRLPLISLLWSNNGLSISER